MADRGKQCDHATIQGTKMIFQPDHALGRNIHGARRNGSRQPCKKTMPKTNIVDSSSSTVSDQRVIQSEP